MQKFIDKYSKYFEPKAIKLIEKCFVLSIIICLFGLIALLFYNTHYISKLVYVASIIVFRTGLMIGLFPVAFALVIGKWKVEH